MAIKIVLNTKFEFFEAFIKVGGYSIASKWGLRLGPAPNPNLRSDRSVRLLQAPAAQVQHGGTGSDTGTRRRLAYGSWGRGVVAWVEALKGTKGKRTGFERPAKGKTAQPNPTEANTSC